jgi:Phage terminase, small subunit
MVWDANSAAKARAKIRNLNKIRDRLTDRERNVCQYLVGGMTQRAAFAKAGYAQGTAESRVLERPAVIRYIEELRERAITRFDYSIENLCARLEHIAYCALAAGEFAPAVSATMGIAKMMGHLADRTEIEMHIISKPAREPTKEVTLSPEEWQRQFTPKQIQ